MLLPFLSVAGAPTSAPPRILSCVAGLPRCIGVPDSVDTWRAWGCPVINQSTGVKETCGACKSPSAIRLACLGQATMTNFTGRDATPVTFSLPVDTSTAKAEYFRWHFSDGSTRTAECAIRGGAPASEANELQTIAIIGDAGGWRDVNITRLEIVGPLMLVGANGTRVSAEGLAYDGDSLSWESGCRLLDARLEAFSTAGETLHGSIFKGGLFPNHCHVNFLASTHRLRLLWNGGVSRDGRHEILPTDTHLFRVADLSGAALPPGAVLGLADLGSAAPPTGSTAQEAYKADGDNYLDICLSLAEGGPLPAQVQVLCGEHTQISMPKGLHRSSVPSLHPTSDPRCRPHNVTVHL
jgi:hypothetical protein